MSDIVIFEAEAQQVEVRLEGETLWITQAQMAELFDVQKAAVSKHLKNIYASGELEQEATVSKMETVRKEGRRTVTRQIEHYNLDAIISVGYRVNSRQATHFRQWATRVLRVYLTQGYSLNEHRLARQGLEELEQAVDLLAKTREERAAHLLYFVIKNHPFSDGNKRSGAFLFLLYLRQEGMRLTLDENGLTALTLLIAESDPKAKDLMVRLVMNLLAVGADIKKNEDA